MYEICKIDNHSSHFNIHVYFIFLKKFLEDDKIVKVGVVPNEDAKHLNTDYGVQTKSTLDLRHMAKMVGCKPLGLEIMSNECLKIKLIQNKRIGNQWENKTLDKKHIDYAANDAHVAIELFKYFANNLQPLSASEEQKTGVQSVMDTYCRIYFDKAFKYSPLGTNTCAIVIISQLDECQLWMKILKS